MERYLNKASLVLSMEKNCAVLKVANIIGKRWTLLILLELYKGEGKKRYTQIKKKMKGITPKILSMRLKELEKHSLIDKQVDASSFPIKSFYSLTLSGKDFMKIVEEMKGWTIRWKKATEHCKETNCSLCNK